MRILGIAGSLRRGSYNRLLLRAAAERFPRVEVYDALASIPLFNEDIENEPIASVTALRERVETADGILIATPEYNWSIPGVLKNAIDWLSRPPREVLARKKVAIIGASGGTWGTRLAQAALRQTLTATEAIVMPAPALFVARAENIFDAGGRLIDPRVSEQLDAVLAAFAAWIGC
jgi:chromate reductase